MYKQLLVLILLIYGSVTLYSQGVEWQTISTWSEAQSKASAEQKPIFIDFYTTWCRPCIVMDRAVFADSVVGDLLNDQFVSLKLNAEDRALGTQMAQRYGVESYPALVYIHPNGEVLNHTVGQQSVYEFVALTHKVEDLTSAFPLIQKAKAHPQTTYGTAELAEILTLSEIHPFEGKKYLTMQYLDGIQDIAEEDLRLVMDEAINMDLRYLKRLAPLTASLSYNDIYLRRNKREWMQWKTNMERAVYGHLDRYKREKNLDKYTETLEILKDFSGIKTRQIDELYLNYYKQNDLDQYRTFATYYIDEYIIPTRPEAVHQADREKYKLLSDEIQRDMNVTLDRSANVEIVDETTASSGLDTLLEVYTISRRIADQLYEISGDFFALYEDDSAHRKARFWASLAHRYFPYDWKYFDNHIYILEATGETAEAVQVKSDARTLPWYHDMLQKNQQAMFGG